MRYIADPSVKRQIRCRAARPDLNKIDYGMVEPPLIEDVFVCCTRFLRMYIHRVTRLVSTLDFGAAPQNRYRDGAPLPGFFWLFAIGELVRATSLA